MAILTVGTGQQFATLASAIAASNDGDTIDVQAGTYVDDFATITKSINLVGVGGMVDLVADENIPDGKAILVTDANVTIDHFEFSGAQVADGNGAGIRYESGNLTITNSYFHNNQDGILTAPVTNGTLSIDHSEFAYNGTGDGYTHDIYVGAIGTFSLTNSYIHDANVGHEVKSRASTTIIANNRILSNASSDSYEIDLPNGGAASIYNNIIQKGPNSQNPTMISYGEEGSLCSNGSLSINNNVFVNQPAGSSRLAVNNYTPYVAQIVGNQFYGLTTAEVAAGANAQSGDSFLSSPPAIDSASHPWASTDGSTLTAGQSGDLVTSAGTWTFGTATNSYGNEILLNGAAAGNGFSQELEVENQGQMYADNIEGQWWAWNGSGWVSTSNPNGSGSSSPDGSTLTVGQSTTGPLQPLGTDPGPVLPTDVSWISGTTTSGTTAGETDTAASTPGTGFHINLLYDAAAMAAPQSFRDGIQAAANLLSAAITDNITVNIKIDYSGTGGGASAGPDNGQFDSYSAVRSDLLTDASPGDTSFNSLPNTSSIQGQSNVAVWNAQLKLFGQLSPNSTTTDDGSATFATDINPNLLVGVALHELTHALGRVPYGPQPDIFDFGRYTTVGTELFSSAIPAPPAYFSLDGGVTKLADYGQSSDPSDFLNSGIQGGNDPFDEFYGSTTLQQLTATDLMQLDALGFNLASTVVTTPSQSLPASLSGNENTAISLSGISVSASPNTLDPLSAVMSVSHGTISVGSTTGGGTVTNNGSGSVTLTGTAAQIDVSLANATYTGNTDYYGADALSVTTTDTADNTQASGSVGIVLKDTTIASQSLPSSLSGNENAAISLSAISVSASPNTLDTLSTVLSVAHGTVSVGSAAGGATVSNNGSGSVTLAGTAVAIDASLANASYTGSTNYTGADSLSVTTIDTADNSQVSGTVEIALGNITSPSQSLPASLSGNENAAISLSAISVSASPNSSDALSTVLSVSHGTISVGSAAGGATVSNNGSGSVILTGTSAAIDASLANASYTGNTNYYSADALSVTTTDTVDNTQSSGSVGITLKDITVASQSLPSSLSGNENAAISLSAISVSASPNSSDALSTVLSVSHGTISVGSAAGGATVSNNGSGSVMLAGTAAAIDASLAHASYTGSTNYTGVDSLSVTTIDTADNSQVSGTVGISDTTTDGSTLTAGQSGDLVTSAGTWTFGTATNSYGNEILLNGAAAGNGFSQELEVENQGQMYADNIEGQWWAWNGSGWVSTSNPNSALVSPKVAENAAATSIGNVTAIDTNGYDAVAWKNGAADQHGVGYADLSGYLSGLDPSLEALEPRSKADFNADVMIGIPHASTLEALDAMVGIPHASTLEALDPIFQQDLNGNGASGTPIASSTTEPYGTAAAHFDPHNLQDSLATWFPLASHPGRA